MSVIPPDNPSQCPTQKVLVAANNSQIHMYGTKIVKIIINDIPYSWEFVIADVQRPLFGADFLRFHGFLVDVRNQRLVNADSCLSSKLSPVKSSIPGLASIKTLSSWWAKILAQFPALTQPEFSMTPIQAEHHIATEGPPQPFVPDTFLLAIWPWPRPHSLNSCA